MTQGKVQWKRKDLLGLRDLSQEEIELILDTVLNTERLVAERHCHYCRRVSLGAGEINKPSLTAEEYLFAIIGEFLEPGPDLAAACCFFNEAVHIDLVVEMT